MVSGVDNEESYAYGEGGVKLEMSVFSFQFYCKSTSALKK